MANVYWVGGGASANWNATGNTNWGSASNTRDNHAVPTAFDDVIFDNSANGNTPCTISAAASCLSLNFTGWANTLTHNAFNLTIGGNTTFVSGMTYTPSSSGTVTINTGTFTTGGKLMPNVNLGSGGLVTLGDNLSFMNDRALTMTIGISGVDLNGKVVSGSSNTFRILIKSDVLGTGRTITCTADNQFANADFKDIIFSSASNRNFSAITGLSGDCGGNSITGGGTTLTFTSSTTQTWNGTTGFWNTSANWTSRMPLPQDDAVLTGTNVVTLNVIRACRGLTFTGATPLTCSQSSATFFGSVNFTSSGTFTNTGTTNFESQARTGTLTLTSAGQSFAGLVNISTVGATLQLADNLVLTNATKTLAVTNGIFDANNKNVTTGSFSGSGALTRSILMGNGTWTLLAGGSWDMTTTTNLTTFTCNSSTIVMSKTASGNINFKGGSITYNNLIYTCSNTTGTDGLFFSGTNIFNSFTVTAFITNTYLYFTSSTTNTFTTFTRNVSTNIIYLRQTSISAFTLAKAGGGKISLDYLNIAYSTATPSTNTWYAGTHSVNSGNNSGWTFSFPWGYRTIKSIGRNY